MSRQPYLECGKIINTHGVRGTVKLESWCDTPEILAGLPTLWRKIGEEFRPIRVLRTALFKQFVLADLEGVADLDAAIALKNTVVFAAREDLDPGDGYFIADLIGLPVYDQPRGVECGRLREVINRGAQDIYVIDTPNGERMIPVVDEFVARVDLESGIYITPIPGMLD
ncbi:MAG: 16S rRNA processing protein RimM [Clostridia bacterium]|nr:16S rRNA processing protein RimM [Clostridia bacterium]